MRASHEQLVKRSEPLESCLHKSHVMPMSRTGQIHNLTFISVTGFELDVVSFYMNVGIPPEKMDQLQKQCQKAIGKSVGWANKKDWLQRCGPISEHHQTIKSVKQMTEMKLFKIEKGSGVVTSSKRIGYWWTNISTRERIHLITIIPQNVQSLISWQFYFSIIVFLRPSANAWTQSELNHLTWEDHQIFVNRVSRKTDQYKTGKISYITNWHVIWWLF